MGVGSWTPFFVFSSYFQGSEIVLGFLCVPGLQFAFRIVWSDTISGSYFGAFVLPCFQRPYAVVGSWTPFIVFRRISRFGARSEHAVRSRNLIYNSNGVVGCGFGVLFVALVLQGPGCAAFFRNSFCFRVRGSF